MTVASVLAACGASRATLALPTPDRLRRTNFSGDDVSLMGGVAVCAGAAGGLLALRDQPRLALTGAIATAAAAAAGWIDDHHEHDFAAEAKGLAGHLGQLAAGKLTSGTVKIGLIGAGALASAGILAGPRPVDLGTRAVTIAASANLVNLLDLRPGRAIKSAVALAAVAATSRRSRPLALLTGAVALSGAPEDLAARTMLGDLGANALGAMVGVALAAHRRPAVRLGAAAGASALIIASEKVSFSHIIESHPLTRRIDEWGR
ncbi:MAG: hypothetical protein Q4P33_03400 [Flaviflexus sp.]|nr:hypothetical protein [Flaviflexus sp.]